MVCIPCFIIPVLLYIWHRFIQPYVLRYWNPWANKDKDGNVVPDDNTKFPFNCSGGKCTFLAKGKSPADKDPQLPIPNKDTPISDSIVGADTDKKQN